MLKHKGTQRLETERLILRRFVLEDAPAMYANWCTDPEVCRFLTWPPHASEAVTRSLLEQWTADYANPENYNWVLELKDGGDIIGSCSVVRLDESIDELEVGYCMGRRWWGNGYMPEAVAAILDYLFDAVGANRVSAKHDVENPKSGRVMQKVGMTFEGIRRQGFRGNRGIRDTACYAILARDRGADSSLDEN